MPDHVLIDLMLALVTAEFLHALSEMLSARFKVGQLQSWLRGQPARTLPVNVNTRSKAYAVLATVAIVLTGVSFAVFSALDPGWPAAVVYTVVVVAATYAVTGIGMDGFHVRIGEVGEIVQSRGTSER